MAREPRLDRDPALAALRPVCPRAHRRPEPLPSPPVDPLSPGFTDDPYPSYAAVRAQAPVYEHPLGFWLLTRYDDVSWLLRAGLSVEDRNVAAARLLRQF